MMDIKLRAWLKVLLCLLVYLGVALLDYLFIKSHQITAFTGVFSIVAGTFIGFAITLAVALGALKTK